MSTNPYVGPRSFREEDRERFFGREREADELLALIVSERLVLFYAQSGAGKSSLINARLRPALRDKEGFEVLPVGRVSGVLPKALKASMVDNIFVFNLIARLNDSASDGEKLSPADLSSKSLAAFLGAEPDKDSTELTLKTEPAIYETAPTVLIIDQFEEILTHHPDQWEKRTDFFRQLDSVQKTFPNLWVLIAMREDHVGALDSYAPLVRNRLRARFYMQRMSYEAALDAVRRPAESSGRPFATDVAEQLVDNLRQMRSHTGGETTPGQFVEPVQLQVVCRQLWSNLGPGEKITAEDLETAGDVDTSLANFYETALATVLKTTNVVEPVLRNWFNRELITEAGTRGTVFKNEDEGRAGSLFNEAVTHLEDQHLIRAESRAGGYWYELAHDRMVQPILDANARWLRDNPLVRRAYKWDRADKPPHLLLSGRDLADALGDPGRQKLGRVIQKFLEASQQEEGQEDTALRLHEAGWGVIFPAAADPAIKDALGELITMRREQAQKRFKIFAGEDGFQPGEPADKFLGRHGVAPASPRFERVPYYLLIVGGPNVIPWEFQYQLGVDHAVGRIHFESLGDYANYARSVVTVEMRPVMLPRQATFFSVGHPDDRASALVREHLASPLLAALEDDKPAWSVGDVSGEEAVKARLAGLLGGPETPTFLFATSHGMGFPKADPRQAKHQGALVCRDWPGPVQWPNEIPADFYFAVDDISADARLLGLIAFFSSDFTAGTPLLGDDAYRWRERETIAPHAFLARLPQQLLSHPRGGALAVIGHVEKLWMASFHWQGTRVSEHFADALSRLLDGYPVGAAMEAFNRRYARLTTLLASKLHEVELKAEIEPDELSGLWNVVIDARNWVVLGDPAVRLAVGDDEEVLLERPTIQPPSQTLDGQDRTVTRSHPVTEPDSQASPTVTPEELYFNGINGDTGDYELQPITVEELAAYIKGLPVEPDEPTSSTDSRF